MVVAITFSPTVNPQANTHNMYHTCLTNPFLYPTLGFTQNWRNNNNDNVGKLSPKPGPVVRFGLVHVFLELGVYYPLSKDQNNNFENIKRDSTLEEH